MALHTFSHEQSFGDFDQWKESPGTYDKYELFMLSLKTEKAQLGKKWEIVKKIRLCSKPTFKDNLKANGKLNCRGTIVLLS